MKKSVKPAFPKGFIAKKKKVVKSAVKKVAKKVNKLY